MSKRETVTITIEATPWEGATAEEVLAQLRNMLTSEVGARPGRGPRITFDNGGRGGLVIDVDPDTLRVEAT